MTTYYPVRCPDCGRLCCEAVAGSTVRVRCVRCSREYIQEVRAAQTAITVR